MKIAFLFLIVPACIGEPEIGTEAGAKCGAFVEDVCAGFAEAFPRPAGAMNSDGETLDLHDPVSCIRTARAGWEWTDDELDRRLFGGCDRGNVHLDVDECFAAVDAITGSDSLEVALDKCSTYVNGTSHSATETRAVNAEVTS